MRKFYTTRPMLAALLIRAGIPHETYPSPFQEGRNMWYFSPDPEALTIVTRYYQERNKEVPEALLESFKPEEAGGGAEHE